MISNLDAPSQLFLADVDRIQQRMNQAEQQITSGKKVSVASDAPAVVSDLLRLRSALQRNAQIQTNLGLAQSATNVSDDTLSNAIQLVDRAITLGAQGATGTLQAAERQRLASDVQALQEELVTLSQTQSGGRYLFSGDAETQTTYQLNLANPNGVDRLLTVSATRQIENPAGGAFPASKTAQDIFDHRNPDDSLATDNLFAAINSLRVALSANDVAGVGTAVDSLKLASDHLNACEAFYGTVQNRIKDALDFSNSYDTQLRTEISQKEDADISAASLEFNQATVNLQAAFQMEGRKPQTTLFDFLTS